MLKSVQMALKQLQGSFINHLLDDVNTDDDFKVKVCEWFSRDYCCALRHSQILKRL